MPTDRRDFLGQLATGAFALTYPAAPEPSPRASGPGDWDLSWVDRLKGKHRAVFDCPAIDAGTGYLRAVIWRTQYRDVLGAGAVDLNGVVVFRHEAIALAMRQEYWDRYKIGKELKVKNPFTDEPTTKNPALLSAKDLPPSLGYLPLGEFIAAGGIVLGCGLAFNDIVGRIGRVDTVDAKEAASRATALLSPGVILQPSGVFAAIRAQQAGCAYLRAS